jgi:hypothetical protein
VLRFWQQAALPRALDRLRLLRALQIAIEIGGRRAHDSLRSPHT